MNNAELVNRDSFTRLRSKNRRRAIRRKIFYALFAIFLTSAVGLVCLVLFFGLEDVDVKGNERYPDEEILEACDFGPSANLFGIRLSEAKSRILSRFPYIRDVSFKRVLPSGLIITVEEDAPAYFSEICGDWYVLSSDLRVISRHHYREEMELLGVPVTELILSGVDYAVTGEVLRFVKTSNLPYFVSFLRELSGMEFYSTVDAIDASDRYHLTLYASGGRFKVSLGDSSDLDAKIRFTERVIETSFNSDTIASLNVESIRSAVVLEQSDRFTYK